MILWILLAKATPYEMHISIYVHTYSIRACVSCNVIWACIRVCRDMCMYLVEYEMSLYNISCIGYVGICVGCMWCVYVWGVCGVYMCGVYVVCVCVYIHREMCGVYVVCMCVYVCRKMCGVYVDMCGVYVVWVEGSGFRVCTFNILIVLMRTDIVGVHTHHVYPTHIPTYPVHTYCICVPHIRTSCRDLT